MVRTADDADAPALDPASARVTLSDAETVATPALVPVMPDLRTPMTVAIPDDEPTSPTVLVSDAPEDAAPLEDATKPTCRDRTEVTVATPFEVPLSDLVRWRTDEVVEIPDDDPASVTTLLAASNAPPSKAFGSNAGTGQPTKTWECSVEPLVGAGSGST